MNPLSPNLNVKAANMIYTNIAIPVFAYSGTVNLNLSIALVEKLDQTHGRVVGIITKSNTMKLKPIITYVKHHACQIVSASIIRQIPASVTNNFQLLSHSKSTRNNKLSIALPRARTKADQNGLYYQGAMI